MLTLGLDHRCAAKLMVFLVEVCSGLRLMLGGEEVGAWTALPVGQFNVVDVVGLGGCRCGHMLKPDRFVPSGPRDTTAVRLLFYCNTCC